MRKTLFLLMLSAGLFTACNKNEGKPTSDNAGKVLQQKTWRMTIYFDNGNDKLATYTGYAFKFSDNGTVEAVRNDVHKYGTWKDTVFNDTVTNSQVSSLLLNFGDDRPFRDLNKNWEVVSKTTKTVHLRMKDRPTDAYDEIYFNLNY